MKRLFTLLVLALAGSAAAFAQSMSNNGHQLTQLWASYDQARKDDLPQKEAEILSQIKQEAQARRLAVDFYDAATQYVGVVQRRDWKQRESALKTLGEEVKAFDEPIVTVLWLSDYQNAATDYQWAYVKDNLDRFQGRNTAFYPGPLPGPEHRVLPEYRLVFGRQPGTLYPERQRVCPVASSAAPQLQRH